MTEIPLIKQPTTEAPLNKQPTKVVPAVPEAPLVPIISSFDIGAKMHTPGPIKGIEKSLKTVKEIKSKALPSDKEREVVIPNRKDTRSVEGLSRVNNIAKPPSMFLPGNGVTLGSEIPMSVRKFPKFGTFVSNIEDSVININGKSAGQVIVTGVSSKDGFDLPDVIGYNCVQYPFREEGDTLVFEGIEYNCEL